MTVPTGARLGAILLAGGRGSRVGGAAKPLFIVGGRTLLAEAAAAAATAGAHPITVVSHLQDAALPVTWLREPAPFGGPVAAIVAALDSWPVEADPEWTLLLACDLPRAVAAVETLCDALPHLAESDGACLIDESGRRQWLTAVYRTAALRRTAADLPDHGRDLPMRALVTPLDLRSITASDDLVHDVDTWDDLVEARRRARLTIIMRSEKEPP